jgi:hypothetical protein
MTTRKSKKVTARRRAHRMYVAYLKRLRRSIDAVSRVIAALDAITISATAVTAKAVNQALDGVRV